MKFYFATIISDHSNIRPKNIRIRISNTGSNPKRSIWLATAVEQPTCHFFFSSDSPFLAPEESSSIRGFLGGTRFGDLNTGGQIGLHPDQNLFGVNQDFGSRDGSHIDNFGESLETCQLSSDSRGFLSTLQIFKSIDYG